MLNCAGFAAMGIFTAAVVKLKGELLHQTFSAMSFRYLHLISQTTKVIAKITAVRIMIPKNTASF